MNTNVNLHMATFLLDQLREVKTLYLLPPGGSECTLWNKGLTNCSSFVISKSRMMWRVNSSTGPLINNLPEY